MDLISIGDGIGLGEEVAALHPLCNAAIQPVRHVRRLGVLCHFRILRAADERKAVRINAGVITASGLVHQFLAVPRQQIATDVLRPVNGFVRQKTEGLIHQGLQFRRVHLGQNSLFRQTVHPRQHPQPASLGPGEFVVTEALVAVVVDAIQNAALFPVDKFQPVRQEIVLNLADIKRFPFIHIHFSSQYPRPFRPGILSFTLIRLCPILPSGLRLPVSPAFSGHTC